VREEAQAQARVQVQVQVQVQAEVREPCGQVQVRVAWVDAVG
jgi:hypothetical protein